MLVIRRKAGESILIGDGIEVTVIDLTPTRVKLGINAATEIPIMRKEIQEAALHNRQAAETVSPAAIRRLLQMLRPRSGPGGGG